MNEFNVLYLDENVTFGCKESEELIYTMHRAGVKPFPIGCRRGGCGICKIRIDEGEFDIIRPMSRSKLSLDEQNQDIVLACCIKPKSDLQISKIVKK